MLAVSMLMKCFRYITLYGKPVFVICSLVFLSFRFEL